MRAHLNPLVLALGFLLCALLAPAAWSLVLLLVINAGLLLPRLYCIQLNFAKSFWFHLLAFVCLTFLRVSNETFNLFGSDPRNLIYDELARSFSQGHLSDCR